MYDWLFLPATDKQYWRALKYSSNIVHNVLRLKCFMVIIVVKQTVWTSPLTLGQRRRDSQTKPATAVHPISILEKVSFAEMHQQVFGNSSAQIQLKQHFFCSNFFNLNQNLRWHNMCLGIKVGFPKEHFTLSHCSLKQMVEAFELQERQGNTSGPDQSVLLESALSCSISQGW